MTLTCMHSTPLSSSLNTHCSGSMHSQNQVRATRSGSLPSFAALHSQVGLGLQAALPTVRLAGAATAPAPAFAPAFAPVPASAPVSVSASSSEGDLLLLDDLTEPPVALTEADKYRVLNQDTGQGSLALSLRPVYIYVCVCQERCWTSGTRTGFWP